MGWQEEFWNHVMAPLVERLQERKVIGVELVPPLRTLVAAFLARLGNLLYVVPDERSRMRVARELRTWQSLVSLSHVLEAESMDLFSGITLQERMKSTENWVMTVSIDDLKREVVEWQYFTAHSHFLQKGQEIKRDHFLDFLFSLGYERVDLVTSKGEVAIRGEVVDLFPPQLDQPVRTFWWGNQVEKLRTFNPETQRTGGELENLLIPPASGFFRTIPFLRILEKAVFVSVFDGVAPEGGFSFPLSVYLGLKRNVGEVLTVSVSSSPCFEGNIAQFVESIQAENWKFIGVILPQEKIEVLSQIFMESGIPFENGWDGPARVHFQVGFLSSGFLLPTLSSVFFSGREIFGFSLPSSSSKGKMTTSSFEFLSTLNPGDYVVHEEQGIGIFQGLKEMVVQGVRRVYLEIGYAGNDVLYVPVENAQVVQKYLGVGEAKPVLSRLGRGEWTRSRERAKRSVEKIARELVELYARRQIERGHAFSPDTPWQRELEVSFPFIETPDQKRAIEEVKRDMESPRPMDRLVCGDVGYGKTEVAVRAAFKAVMDGKQVVVLAPTTLLSEQHYLTFSERMKAFPVRIAVLNRFRTPGEQREILEKVKSGEIDILVGTHRLLSKDVVFRDLGLLIIDEEQRFGVFHKERLRTMKASVDVLTLTATPIPRTLYLSLLGIKDVSLIETPPEGRKPITTLVLPRTVKTIREAIGREIERGGQVFYVCPRIRDLFRVEKELREVFPHLSFGIAHGRLKAKELEEMMRAFYQGVIPVLLCTTIVEIGLDVPRANTLIVDPATLFGLAQLYQLRGRIGRFDREAFAYFLYPSHLRYEAQERLEALLEFSTTGSGAKLAMRDLEIRGAGNILGTEQHGFIQEVGFSLYLKLLQEEVALLKGENKEAPGVNPRIFLRVNAYIPSTYLENETERLHYYRRFWESSSLEDILELVEELQDRFGRFPEEVENLFQIARLRYYAKITQVESIEEKDDGIYIEGSLETLGKISAVMRNRIETRLLIQNGRVVLRLPRLSAGTLVQFLERMSQNG
ncbi:MAG: transcription-repair coupling factor [Atribacterota bacterium]